jgi:hypothetical protein
VMIFDILLRESTDHLFFERLLKRY